MRHFSSLLIKVSAVAFVALAVANEARSSSPSLAADMCSNDMVLVSGGYCPRVELHCLHWLDAAELPFARCAEYANPARCLANRVAMRFCIDRYEHTPAGERLPSNFASFVKAEATCKSLGKRVCDEEEWTLACEGETLQPYPYGFERRPVCNQDRYDLYVPGSHRRILRDLREPSTARPDCVSPFGVFNLVGNLEEPVRRRGLAPPFSSALKGGWWMPARNRCRSATTRHNHRYQGIQIGVRCCADAQARSPSQ
jgi:formylglycine-generating enzyme